MESELPLIRGREKVREMLDKEDKDFSGVLSTAKTALTLYKSDPLVAEEPTRRERRHH